MYLPKGKYCVYPRMAIVIPPPPPFWMTEKRISIALLAISKQYATLIFFSQNGCRRPFWMTNRISRHFIFYFVHKMAAGDHFGLQKITFDRISRHFRSICNFFVSFWMTDQYATFIFWFFSTKWLPAAILDDRKSLFMTFLAISDQYATFFLHKMAANGHFRWPKITFDRISRHFRSMRNLFYFFFKMATGRHYRSPFWAILEDRKSLSIAFLAISDQYTTFYFYFFPNGRQRPFWKSDLRQIE